MISHMTDQKQNLKVLFAGTQMTLVGIAFIVVGNSSGLLFGFGIWLVAAGTLTVAVSLIRN